MNMKYPILRSLVLSGLTIWVISGCTLKASTDTSTDASSNFTSSTTPGVWFTIDGLLKSSEKFHAFVGTNFEVLQQEMAQGEGEYLSSLGTLLKVPPEQMTYFRMQTQELLGEWIESNGKDLTTVAMKAADMN